MPFVEGGIVVDAEPQQQAAPPMAQGGFVQGGIEVDPTPEDSYNKVLQFQAAQTDYTPSKQEFLDYLKVSKTKPLLGEKPLETIGTAAVQTAKDIATMPYKLGEAVGEIYQPPEGATEGDVALGTAAEIAAQSKLKAQSMARGAYDVALSNLEKLTGKLRSDDDRYEAFLATSEIKRQLARANAPEEERVPAAQEFLQAYNIPQEALSQPGLEVGGFLADPSSIAFAGGGKAASALLQRALPLIPRAGQMIQRGGERISTLGQAPETGAGALATKITGSPQMGQAVQEAIAKGTTGVALGEAAGLPITAQLNVPGLGTASQIIGGTKALGATLETIGEAGAVSGGPALTAIQRGLLGAGERIAAAEGASAGAKAFGNAIARSGLEAPIKGAGAILVPMVGAGVGGAALAGLTGEEGDAIAAAFGSGAAFGAFDAGFHLAKAASADAFKGGRVRQTAVDDLNTRPTEVQFTYVDSVAGEQTSTIKDADARAQLYASLNNKQLTKALSEVAGAEGAGVDVIFHTDADTVPTALQTVNYAGVSIGPKNIKSGRPTILINVDKATPEAIPHEILHAKITQDVISQLGSKVIESMIRSEESPNEATKFEKQFTEFATNYAEKIKKSGGAVISDQILTELRDGFDTSLQRAQRIEALKRITDEFSAYYTQEMLKGKDPKTMLPGRIPSFIEMALNNAKEAVSERFTRRALQAGFDPVARSFYDANGRRIKIDWMEDAIKNLVTPKEGYEPTEQKVDINKMTKAQQNALIMARGYSDLFMTAPDGSIVRPLSKAELAAKTADVANRTMKVVESVPQADRTSVSGMDAKGNPVIEGRLSLAEADAVSKSGIFSPSTSRSLIDIAMGIRDGTLMEGKYWKVYGSTGKSGVFGESEKLFLPYGISINSKGGVNVKVVDWGKVQARMYKALTKPAYKNLFRNYDQAMSTLKDVYLKNIAEQNAAPSAEALGGGIDGAKKRNFFNEVMGSVPKKGDVMSNLPTAGYVANRKGGSVYQDLRIERLQNTNPTGAKIPWTGDMGEQSSYRRTQLNFQPAETIGETQVSTDQNGGYRILSKNGKFRLYGPDGSTVGIFDTEGQAKLKAEKDYATQARLQPEVRQQQYPVGNEVRQTAEAGRGDSAVGRTQGREEGRQELGAVRQAGDVITPESPEVARKVVSGDTSALKDGELLGTFRFMPPDLIDKLAVTDEQRKAMRGKSGFAFVSDWADAGRPYVTRLGRNIDVLMGGMGYPFLPEISGKGAWAGTFSGMTDTVMKKIKATDGIGLVVLGGPESSASSRAFSRAFGEELADSMSQNPKLKEKLDKIARNARKQWIEYRRGEGKSIDVPEINSLEDWARLTQLERAGEQSERGLTFSDRDFLVRTIGSHDNKKALGIRSWKDVLRNYNLQNKDFTPGQVVAVVQFSGAEPVRAETVGAKVHPSYEALIPGKAIGTLPQKTMIKDVFRDFLSKTQPPAFTRKIQTNMPKFVVGEGDMRFMPSSLTARDINAIASEVGGGDVKGGAKAFGAFMRSMRDKGITLRDVVKSYGITLSSIQRQELPVSTIKKNWPDAPFQEGTKVRPEDAFAQLLGTPEGQKYLDAAESGVFDEQAADAVVQKFRSFGFHNKLKEQMKTAVEQFYPKAQEIIDAVNTMPTDKFIDYVRNNFKGISYGKVGFWSGQLGRGDIPTFDSRQGKLVYGKEVPVTKQVLMEQKDRLTQLGINVPAAFKDFAQTLLHHEVWDRLNQSDTEHGPIKEAMLRYMPSDTDYLSAVKQGDTQAAQRMVDEAAKAAGYTTKVFHGSISQFNKPNTPLFLGDEGTAMSYAQDRAMAYGEGANPVTYKIYAKFKNPASETDVKEAAMDLGLEVENDMAYTALDPQISGSRYVSRVISELKKRGYDSANIDDFSPDSAQNVIKSFVAFDPSQLKRSDPITKDDNGNVIPLSQRFKATSEDIRFMPDYSGEHKAPQRDSGAPLDNLKGIYPDDVYGPNAARYYGHASGDATDKAAARIIQATKGKPDAPVKVFRAIPKGIQSNEINPGDWITTIKSYAVQHGEGALGGDYKILEKTVNAGDLYTNGDSIFEFGYDPKFMPAASQREVGRNVDFANPPTEEKAKAALSSSKQPFWREHESLPEGSPVGVRIDIPAFLNRGTYVQTIHEPATPGNVGDRIGYDTSVRLSGPVRFFVKEGSEESKLGAVAIKEGRAAKHPIATVEGRLIKDRSIPSDIETWTPVGMDPKKHSYFYDKRTDQPVTGGSESFSVGNTVFVKNPVYGKPQDFRYMPSPDSSMPGAYTFTGGYRALPGKAKGSLRLYGPAGSLIGIASSLDEAQRILRRKNK